VSQRRSGGLWLFTLKRLAYAVPFVVAIAIMSFFLIRLTPGDPVTALTGGYPVPEEHRAAIRSEFGLDKSLLSQLLAYVGNLLQGDLGYSYANNQPVLELIMSRVGATLLLMVTAMVVAALVGIPLGVLASRKAHSTVDSASTLAALWGYAIPVFWLGQVLILLFAITWAIFPSGGMTSSRTTLTGSSYWLDVAWHLVLPVLALSVRYIAVNMRLTRASMLEAMRSDYILTARAKGISERTVLFRHGLKNAMLPVVTMVGYNFGFALGGSVLVETVFAWPGIGRLLFTSIGARDYPVVMGVFIFMGVAVILANLITDIVYARLDPRIRY
jgi:peptide/nickel transport system permease protein